MATEQKARADQSLELPPKQQEIPEAQAEGEKQDSLAREIGMALIRDSQNGDMLGKLSRYEASLQSGFIKTLNMLLLVQSRRIEGSSSRQRSSELSGSCGTVIGSLFPL